MPCSLTAPGERAQGQTDLADPGVALTRLIVSRVFTWTPLRVLGRVSFSFYLVHYVVVLTVAGWMTPVGLSGMLSHYLVAFGLSVLVATMLYRGVERKYHAIESRPLRSALQHDEPSIAGAAPSG